MGPGSTAEVPQAIAGESALSLVPTFVVVAGTAGVEQAQNHFAAYGQGAQGYAKRFGANLDNSHIRAWTLSFDR